MSFPQREFDEVSDWLLRGVDNLDSVDALAALESYTEAVVAQREQNMIDFLWGRKHLAETMGSEPIVVRTYEELAQTLETERERRR